MDTRHPPTRPLGVLPLALLLALAAAPAAAGTLGEAVGAALERSGELARPQAITGERDALARQAASPFAADPALRLSYLSDRATEDAGAYEVETMVDMPLWLPGQRDARRQVAAAVGGQAGSLDRRLRWEIAGEVREKSWAAAIAAGRLRQTEQALSDARALEAAIDKRVGAGELARVDLLVARQQTLEREAELRDAQLEHDRALADYRQLTGLQTLPEPLRETPASTDALPTDHPLLEDADSALALARAEREQAQRERRGNPVLSVGGKRAREVRGADTADSLQLEISLPFGLASQSAPALARAERGYTERATDLQRARLAAERTLIAAQLAREGAATALTVAERRHALAQQALQLGRRAFDLGERDLTDLLRTQASARVASLDLALRRLELGRAQARLNQALGVIPQ
ncbi:MULTISPECIES: TolC family protein [Marichromatium]|uniref:Outer membrane efflux protein n=2 Tax=Marichromatium TaxID=85076 RepID=A0A4R4AKJ5_MARGR|nr:TolC family protein [Marichromatium gracile]MBK1707597.1 transporter [Marichromatium gracile]MBO8087111.1 TolC family protein [Marichromatium sp.]TCW39948.1 outer membrane efflux protein [Marichromatium gracile]